MIDIEQVLIQRFAYQGDVKVDKCKEVANELRSLFRAEIEKLKIMTEEEVNEECGDSLGYGIDNWLKELLEVQLTKTKEDLRKVTE